MGLPGNYSVANLTHIVDEYLLVNDGHTVKIELGPSVDAQIQDLEFHWPSEFVIDGHRFPLEMKMKRCNNTQCWFEIFLYDVSVHHNLWMNSVVKIIEFAEEPIQLVAFNGSLPSLDLNLLHSEFLSRPNVLWMSGHTPDHLVNIPTSSFICQS